MPYADYETGAGRPTELYEFQVGSTFVRVTSAARAQTIGSNTYDTLSIRRTAPAQSKDIRAGEITLQTPADFSIVTDFRSIIPYTLPMLTIYRFHQQDSTSVYTFWKGFVSSVAAQDNLAEIVCQSIERIFNKQIPRFVYSGVCNHTLYDSGCKVDATAFDFQSTVSSLSTTALELTISGLRAAAAAIAPGLTSAELDVFWQGGYLEDGPATERRMILEGNVGGDPDVVRVLLPFRNISSGSVIRAFAGCDHSIATCEAKFGNQVRFGGFPYVPSVNPFTIDLDGGV